MTGPIARNSGKPLNRSRILSFELSGSAQLPQIADKTKTMQPLTKFELKAKNVNSGFKLYYSYCVACHGAGALGGIFTPVLRCSPFLPSADNWKSCFEVSINNPGSGLFSAELSSMKVEAIRQKATVASIRPALSNDETLLWDHTACVAAPGVPN